MPSLSPEDFLHSEFEKRIRKNPSYSMRAFAKTLQLSPGELSEILRKKRKISLKSALKIARQLGLSPLEHSDFIQLFMPAVESTRSSRLLSDDQFRIVSDWFCIAIISLYETKGFRFDAYWIAKRLAITATEARAALERMQRTGIIVIEKGKLKITDDYFMSLDEVPSRAVKDYHLSLLDKAKEAVENDPLTARELGGITFALHPHHLPELKREIKKFLDSFARKTSQKSAHVKTEVYHLENCFVSTHTLRRQIMKIILAIFTLCWYCLGTADAGTTRIGNGDDGSDLEGFDTVAADSPLERSRQNVVHLLEHLHTEGVPGLGTLLPEVEHTKIFLTKKDSTEGQAPDHGAFHADLKGRVYARTLAEPHASTRFFPVSLKLDDDQLVALHVHEGLHRSLNASVREHEEVVAEMTLAITAPGANYDSIARLSEKLLPQIRNPSQVIVKAEEPRSERITHPSLFAYEYRNYRNPSGGELTYPVNAMHIIGTELYPFDLGRNPVGLGIKFSLISKPTSNLMGPLELSANWKLWSNRSFDVGLFATAALNTLSNEELKVSQFGRDAYLLGISIRKDLTHFSIENDLSYLFPSESTKAIGAIDYHYRYGGIVGVSTHPAVMLGDFRLGGFLELLLADYFKIQGGAYQNDIGKYRVFSGGPELEFRYQSMVFGLSARYLINSTKDASFDTLGNLMGTGVAQGSINAKFSILF